MFCRSCGKEIGEKPEVCPHCSAVYPSGTTFCQACGYAVQLELELCARCGSKFEKLPQAEKLNSRKSRTVVALLAVLPGWLGIAGLHRFYLGKILTGVIMLLTLGGLGIWTLVDFIMALTGRMKDRQGKPVTEW